MVIRLRAGATGLLTLTSRRGSPDALMELRTPVS